MRQALVPFRAGTGASRPRPHQSASG